MRDATWEDIFKLSASAAASEFCEWVQIGIDVYIPHHKFYVKPHSFPWFSAACAAASVHRNHFFRLYQQNKSFESKGKFRPTSNCCKWVLDEFLLMKQKSSSLPRNLTLRTSGILLIIVFSTKVHLLYFLYSTEMLSSASDKAKLFAKNLSKNSNLDNLGISLTVFPSRTSNEEVCFELLFSAFIFIVNFFGVNYLCKQFFTSKFIILFS